MAYSLASDVVLRVGDSGALAFRKTDGLRVRLNATGGRYLAVLHGREYDEAWRAFRETYPDAPASPDEGANRVLLESMRRGIISDGPREEARIIELGEPASPEVVHLLITDRCNYKCVSCYAGNEATAKLLTLDELRRLADELTSLGVLELAIGGGEPMLRRDLEEFVAYASRTMVVNVTTNGSLMSLKRALALRGAGVNMVQVSVNGPDEETNALGRDPGTWMKALDALATLDVAGVRHGCNIVITRSLLGRIEETLRRLGEYDPHQVVLIRPKPRFRDDPWFEANKIRREDMEALAREVRALPHKFPGIVLTVDSTYGPLFHDVPPERLRRIGFQGLAGGVTSCAVDADGSVYPGSHFANPLFLAGNVRERPLGDIWREAPVMGKFRELVSKIKGACRACQLLDVCNDGCRKTAWVEGGDLYAGDAYCVRAAAG